MSCLRLVALEDVLHPAVAHPDEPSDLPQRPASCLLVYLVVVNDPADVRVRKVRQPGDLTHSAPLRIRLPDEPGLVLAVGLPTLADTGEGIGKLRLDRHAATVSGEGGTLGADGRTLPRVTAG